MIKFNSPALPQKPGQTVSWTNLHGSSSALAISQAAAQHDSPILVICNDTNSARQLEHACRFFLNNTTDIPVLHFPDWETLPYDSFSPHQDLISERLQTLYNIEHLKRGIIITPVSTLMHYVVPTNYVNQHSFCLEVGQNFNLDKTRLQLEESGYRSVNQVLEHGEFAVRGSLFDVFPMGSDYPIRIDLFDDEIDSIRTFDTESQRSLDKIQQLRILPAKEFPMTETSVASFRQQWRESFTGRPNECPVYQDISNQIIPAGIEYYLPFFFNELQTLFDYLPQNSMVSYFDDLEDAADHFWDEVSQRYEQLRHDQMRPILSPNDLFIKTDALFAKSKTFARIKLSRDTKKSDSSAQALSSIAPTNYSKLFKSNEILKALAEEIKDSSSKVLFIAESPGRKEALVDLLKQIDLLPHYVETWQAFIDSEDAVNITVGLVDDGLKIAEPEITIYTEAQLFGQKVSQRRRNQQQSQAPDIAIKHLAELKTNDPVVHIQHGVGRYLGLQVIDVGDTQAEFLTLEYADTAKLYVPVSSLNLISRYSGIDPEHAPLHKLGNQKWSKDKEKAAKQARDVAVELLDIYARREVSAGNIMSIPTEYVNFCDEFPFEETIDQSLAIEQILSDMQAAKSMDRLVCGDVGFGKTEVAMRAAFIAVQNGYQVAVLVPTTLLAQQHHTTFSDRFANWPVRVEVLSRFKTAKQQNTILDDIENGKVDIIVSTHKLIQNSIDFKNLGLLIIDEEHRFGVKQKEKIKSLRSQVDILTLTATPIPRTLNMSMSEMRDLSIISTPPSRRLSVKTFVHENNQHILKEAILREIHRGGQVYFLHNEVETIDNQAAKIQELLPEARVEIAHGQMREKQLERVMSDFYHQHFNVLVCTTIIETGIDIPSANTIIINRADRFGLAQLHQLRGRVGRSHHQAYAYLFVNSKKTLTKDANKRLEAIATFDELGAGFMLATHDLEIRGAGELLGQEQSGQMQAIGFNLYMRLLQKTVKALKSGESVDFNKPFDEGIEVNMKMSALIPEDYIHDPQTRLTLYKRIASAENDQALDELKVEFIDRFGLLPESLKNLFQITKVKLIAEPMGIEKIEVGTESGYIDFSESPKINFEKLILIMQNQKSRIRFDGKKRLRFTEPMHSEERRIQHTRNILQELAD